MEEYIKRLINQLHSGVDYIYSIHYKNGDDCYIHASEIIDMKIVQNPCTLMILFKDGGFTLVPFGSILMIDCQPCRERRDP